MNVLEFCWRHAGVDVNSETSDDAACTLNCKRLEMFLERGAELRSDASATCLYRVVENEYKGIRKASKCIQFGGYQHRRTASSLYNEYYHGGNKKRTFTCDGCSRRCTKKKKKKKKNRKRKIISWKNIEADRLGLKHLCRGAVRKQMITANPHDKLFQAIPKLDIPSAYCLQVTGRLSVNYNS